MLRDLGLFSQVISWDSRYADFYSLRGAHEERRSAASRLQSHCKEFGPGEIKHDLFFFFLQEIADDGRTETIADMIKVAFLIWGESWNNAATIHLFSYRVRTYQVNLK